ncbi:hypothetical protein ACFLWS_08035, partial [Chloroflexota bacterium]
MLKLEFSPQVEGLSIQPEVVGIITADHGDPNPLQVAQNRFLEFIHRGPKESHNPIIPSSRPQISSIRGRAEC